MAEHIPDLNKLKSVYPCFQEYIPTMEEGSLRLRQLARKYIADKPTNRGQDPESFYFQEAIREKRASMIWAGISFHDRVRYPDLFPHIGYLQTELRQILEMDPELKTLKQIDSVIRQK